MSRQTDEDFDRDERKFYPRCVWCGGVRGECEHTNKNNIMKNKELIEELQKFNPDGTATVFIQMGDTKIEAKVVGVEDEACAMINPVIVAKE
jgi:hypothetical protein